MSTNFFLPLVFVFSLFFGDLSEGKNTDVSTGLLMGCDLNITAVTPSCAFNDATGQSTFSVRVDVSWDYADLLTTPETILVSFNGTTMSTASQNMATGTASVTFSGVTGPAYGLLVEAAFATTSACTATSLADLVACPSPCGGGANALGGNVFKDSNNDGAAAGAGEVGQENVLVEIYECDGTTPAYTTYTNASGEWSVPTSAGLTYPVRVEFSTPLQPELQPSFVGVDNGTNTQFLAAPSCTVDYGVLNIMTFCDDPFLVTPCYVNGDNTGTDDVVLLWSYENEGFGPGDKQPISLANDVASTWGLAYNPCEQMLYAAAALKRHVGLKYEADGSGGLDAIYTIDPFATASNGGLWLELNDLGINVGTIGNNVARGVDNTASNDPEAYGKAGTVGIGDIDVSEDGTRLYVMNLFDKTLYEIDIATKTKVGEYPVPDPSCSNGVFRPWAVKSQDGKIYVGGVCDGSSAGKDATAADALTNTTGRSDLSAFVYALDGGSFTQVLSFSLDYVREATDRYNGTCNQADGWFPWVGSAEIPRTCTMFGSTNVIGYPQPLLSDIEFADDGDMIIGFMDRTGLQIGNGNYGLTGNTLYGLASAGDILHACANVGGSFTIESAGCANTGGHYLDSDSGNYNAFPDGHGEYYGGDFFQNNGTITLPGAEPGHGEISLGGLAVLPGSGEVILTTYNPVTGGNDFARGGVIRLSQTTGERTTNGFQLYDGSSPGNFGKGVGLGDLELVCSPPPIQIGNYVWIDDDKDGVQDACEDPVSGLPVTLYTQASDGTLTQVATTTTSPSGEYYFTGDGTAGENWMNPDELVWPDTSYVIIFGDQTGETITVAGVEYELTTAMTGEGTSPSLNDSDATSFDLGGTMVPAISYNTADSTDHTLDVGWVLPETFDLALIKRLDLSTNPGPFTPGSTVDFTITVYNQGDIDATDVEVKDYIPEGLSLAPASAPNWTISVDTAILTAPFSLSAGAEQDLNISFIIDADFMQDTLTNLAEISNFDDDNNPATGPPEDEDSTPNDNGMDPAEANTPDELDDDGDGTPGTEDDPRDEDDFDFEGIAIECNQSVVVSEPFTVCINQTIDLTQGVTVMPETGATWTTPDGTGSFLNATGNVLTMPYRYGTAVTYQPTLADASRGSVTLTLTTDVSALCDTVSDSVTITVLQVDCGSFPWGGQ